MYLLDTPFSALPDDLLADISDKKTSAILCKGFRFTGLGELILQSAKESKQPDVSVFVIRIAHCRLRDMDGDDRGGLGERNYHKMFDKLLEKSPDLTPDDEITVIHFFTCGT